MNEIYGKSKIVLIPSLVDETFCMVGLEAMINSIPCIYSTRGNLPYLFSHGGGVGVSDKDIESWITETIKLSTDDEYYNDISSKANNASLLYDPDEQCEKFLSMVFETVNA